MTNNELIKPKPVSADIEWFINDRFGMFIHWGIYALPARHEWVQSRELISEEEYRKYFEHFNPDLYNPREWAVMARKAGMKYAVITTKHHDGFCLWDSQHTEYKATNTPAGRDLLRPFVEAFRAEGLKIGFYHSLIDWHHPHFTIDYNHPLREHPQCADLNRQRDIAKYREYLHLQTRELLTEFGKIDIIWFDFSYPQAVGNLAGKGRDDWGSRELLQMVRRLQPGIIVNNRLDLPLDQADIHTPEQFQPPGWVTVNGEPVYWETCQTFSGSWGYHRDEKTWKDREQMIKMLINSVSCGGNLLINIGPTGRGLIDNRATEALQVYEQWMKLHCRAIYGCSQSQFTAPAGCRLTQNSKRVYIHIYDWPFRFLLLDRELFDQIEYAQLLNDASEVKLLKSVTDDGNTTMPEVMNQKDWGILELPVDKPDVTVPVIELFLNK